VARLAHQAVSPGQASRWVLVAHGVFGRGQNWRTIARKLCERCPGLGAILLDLRGHGRSASLDGEPTFISAVSDVVETAQGIEQSHGRVCALIGHSFGGKVMLAASAELELDHTWVIDASPSANPAALDDPNNTAPAALASLERIFADHPNGFEDRDELIGILIGGGAVRGVAQFLAMNLARGGDGRFRSSIDLAVIRSLLEGYFATDLWDLLEVPASPLSFAVASRASALSAPDQERLRALADRVSLLSVHDVAESGHWIHADQPAALLNVIAPTLA